MPIVRENLDRIAHFPVDHLSKWEGRSYVYTSDGYRWEDQPVPMGGERAAYSDFAVNHRATRTDAERAEGATHIAIPGTAWGDYSGDDYTRSNYRSILRDFPEHVVDIYGDYGFSGLALALDSDVPEELLDGLEWLLEYPLWDESDHSDLVMELEQEDWDSWGRSDLMSEVRDLAQQRAALRLCKPSDPDRVEEYLDGLEDTDLNVLASDAAYGPDGHGEHPMYVAETATGGYWEGFRDEWAPKVLDLILSRFDAEDTPARWRPVPVLAGQASLI
jgi:hypothetical protein